MSKIIDLTATDGDLIILGKSLVIPNSEIDTTPNPLNGAIRFNPTIGMPQCFSNGSWITLGSGGSGGGSDNNHTHTISQIIGLADALANKAPLIHAHSINDVTGLTTALAGKSAIGHNHSIADITNLQNTLDNKSNVGHTHGFTEKEKVALCLPGSPPSLFKLVWTASDAVTFPTNLSGSFASTVALPTANYTITLYKNVSTAVGTIIIGLNGSVTFTASSFSVVAGDTLTFAFPSKDTTLNTLSLTVIGYRAPQTIS